MSDIHKIWFDIIVQVLDWVKFLVWRNSHVKFECRHSQNSCIDPWSEHSSRCKRRSELCPRSELRSDTEVSRIEIEVLDTTNSWERRCTFSHSEFRSLAPCAGNLSPENTNWVSINFLILMILIKIIASVCLKHLYNHISCYTVFTRYNKRIIGLVKDQNF